MKKDLIIVINKDNLKYYQFLLGGFKVYGLKQTFILKKHLIVVNHSISGFKNHIYLLLENLSLMYFHCLDSLTKFRQFIYS